MKFPLSEKEYKALELVAKQEGVTVDQAAQIAILTYLKHHEPKLLEQAKKRADPEVLRVFEKS